MGRRGRRVKRKNNAGKFIIFILIIIIIVAGYILYKKINKEKEKVENTTAQTTTSEEQPKEEPKNNVIEVEVSKNKTNKIDFLANLDVPVYKKSEKNIKIPILIYHAFATPIPEDDVYKLFSSQANFEENVSTLKNDGYTFITLEDLYRYNKGEIGLPEKVIIITMDDGWIGCYTEAYPVLKKYNVPATIFVVNKLVGTEDYFSWEQAKEMYDSGYVKIHCHGYSHIDYSKVSISQLQSDYTKSQEEIIEHLGDTTIQKIMAYPAGASSRESIAALKEIGFEVQVQTKYGTVNKSSSLDLTGLGRIRAERATGKQILATINSASI